MSEILFVSKPIAPPWNDGSKTLVRDLAGAMLRYEPVVLGVRGVPLAIPRGRVEPLFYQPNEGFGLSGTPAMRLAARLASGKRGDAWHFVFAPTARTGRTARALASLRRVRTVQTVASVPREDEDLDAALFADRLVVLSRKTERLFLARGIAPPRLTRIAPCVADVPRTRDMRQRGRRLAGLPSDVPIVLFPGDLERDRGARVTIEAVAALPRSLGVVLVIAARRKSHRSAEAERAMRQLASDLGIADRVRWVGESPHVHALIAAADVVALPAADLAAKVDLPIILLEALSLGVPVVVARGSSAEDLAEGQGALAVPPDRESLAIELERIVDDTELRTSLGTSARAAYEARYRPEGMAAQHEALYDELLR